MHFVDPRTALLLALMVSAMPASAGWSWKETWSNIVDTVTAPPQDASSDTQTVTESMTVSSAPVITSHRNVDTSNFKLPGRWKLIGAGDKKPLGTLNADNSFFTLILQDPKLELRTAYTQAGNGDFVCTVLDKNVVVMEGTFENESRIGMNIRIKSIGKADTKTYAVIAVRES